MADATFPKPGKKSKKKAKKKAVKKSTAKPGAKVWCQFEVSPKLRDQIRQAMKARDFKNSADYAKSLFDADLKKLGSKIK